ncbi:MAG: hypothetical protein JNM57_02160 [Cyclobacteriaceae bacterium]|nr:hypothetical protein [Cyclobacteriaceae bacterium]
MREWIVAIFLILCFTGIAMIFWQQELQYARPTPLPARYTSVGFSERINLSGDLAFPEDSALYFHFFNPDCPCSRFNSKHFSDLVNRFQAHFKIYAVIPAYADLDRAQRMLGDRVTVVQDHDDVLAKACGVYATPQAVILDKNHQLFYRGNYNKSRYCTLKESNFAELALTAFVNGEQLPAFSPLATQAYGCELPAEDNTSFFEF